MTVIARNGNEVIFSSGLSSWFEKNEVHFRIAGTRKSKLGDYRPPWNHMPARITINSGLNPYEFLITLIHEMAHHTTWKEWKEESWRGRIRPEPHGKEWKRHFQEMMTPFLNSEFFPDDILEILRLYVQNPTASSKTNLQLGRVLKNYDGHDNTELLENLPTDALFHLPDGRIFKKKEKLRKRYRCLNMENRRTYLFHPLVKIIRD
ncbi:MAG: sprT domain-containing protein [Bacteroidota bacterium]|nr:sprT domain-containing protein [Bacteroidota bacterium]